MIHRGNNSPAESNPLHPQSQTPHTLHFRALSLSRQSSEGDENHTCSVIPSATKCSTSLSALYHSTSTHEAAEVDTCTFTVIDHRLVKNGVGYMIFYTAAKKPLPLRLQQAARATSQDTLEAVDGEQWKAESSCDKKFTVTEYKSANKCLAYTILFTPARKPLLQCPQQAHPGSSDNKNELLVESNCTFTVTDYHSERKSVGYTVLFTPAKKPLPHHLQATTSPDYSDVSDSESEDESTSDSSDDEEDCCTCVAESSPRKEFEDFSEEDQICIKLNIEIAMRSVKGAGFGNPQKWARPPVHPRVKELRLETQSSESERIRSRSEVSISPLITNIHCM